MKLTELASIIRSKNAGPATLTFDIDNLFDTRGQRNRLFFFPSRANPVPSLDEFRERNSHLSLSLTLKRTFGGATKTPAAPPT